MTSPKTHTSILRHRPHKLLVVEWQSHWRIDGGRLVDVNLVGTAMVVGKMARVGIAIFSPVNFVAAIV